MVNYIDYGFWITTQWSRDCHGVQMDYDMITAQGLIIAPSRLLEGNGFLISAPYQLLEGSRFLIIAPYQILEGSGFLISVP